MNDQKMGRRLPIEVGAAHHIANKAHHSCKMCGHGCFNYDVMLTPQEVQRLSLNWWRGLLERDIPDDMPLVLLDNTTGQYTLNKRPDGRCVFLGNDNLCILHKEAGLDVKPIACQFFPMHAVQAPDGLHISLNTGCHRLIEMTQNDPLLESSEADRLLSGVEAITTIGDTVPLTPDQEISYDEFVVWQQRLLATLTVSHTDYWLNLKEAAVLLLTIPADNPAPRLRWNGLYISLARLLTQVHTERKSTSHLMERSSHWLPIMEQAELNTVSVSENASVFFTSVARQYLEGRQAALHRTARSAWVALLAAMVGALYGSYYQQAQNPELNPDHTLNERLSDMLDIFFLPVGQLALTEPEQQAFLTALAAL